MELKLDSEIIYENNLDTIKFAKMLDDPSQCYKFYWLEAILNLIRDNEVVSFDAIINEMICGAWYTVTCFHLHLGPVIKNKTENFLEHAINTLAKNSDLSQDAEREDIIAAIKLNEKELRSDKTNLTNCVPYRLLSSFLDELGGGNKLWNQRGRLIEYINRMNEKTSLLYTIIDGKGLQKKIRINPHWRQLILDNYPVIYSWIQLKKNRLLKDRNPGVPGIIYKLERENNKIRKLHHARELWKSAVEIGGSPIYDIYSGKELDLKSYDLDHFVPRSYIANDELWNLTPMEKRLNSSKNNRLPEWDSYFPGLAGNQYYLYKIVFSNPGIRKKFENCRRDNLNAIWASETLFIEGNTEERFTNILEHNLKPLHESALLQGYGLWKCPADLIL